MFHMIPRSESNGSDISSDYGFANLKTNKVYIRDTGVRELNEYLIGHEISHLLESKKTHMDANGICHKGGFFHNLVNTVMPFIGPAIQGDRAVFKTGAQTLGNGLAGALPGIATGNAGAALAGGFQGSMQGGPFGQAGPGGYGTAPQMSGQSQQTGMGQMFPTTDFNSYGQGFGQTAAPAPSGMGPRGGQGAPMTNVGLGAGIPNNASITMGQGAQGNQDTRQSGFYFPSYRF